MLLAAGIAVAGGTAAYMRIRNNSTQSDSFRHHNGDIGDKEQSEKLGRESNIVKKSRQKKGGLKSLQVLAAILLSRMGRPGAKELLALVATVVS